MLVLLSVGACYDIVSDARIPGIVIVLCNELRSSASCGMKLLQYEFTFNVGSLATVPHSVVCVCFISAAAVEIAADAVQ